MKAQTLFLSAAALSIVAAVIVALGALPSPEDRRKSRLDDRRERDLLTTKQQLDEFVRTHNSLPDSLDALNWAVPEDPVSGEPYGYRRRNARQAELCAHFAARATEGVAGFAKHPAGRHCFDYSVQDRSDRRVSGAVRTQPFD